MPRTPVLFVLVILLSGVSRSQTWIPRNPSPHGEQFVSMVAKGDSLLASTTGSGILSFSSDGGRSWSVRSSTLIPSGGVLGIAQDNGIVLSPRSGSIYRTTDWGSSWSIIRDRYDVSHTIGIHFFDADEALLVAPNPNDSLFVARSTDGGRSWDEQRLQFDHVRIQSVSFLPAGTLFLAGYRQIPNQNTVVPWLIRSADRFRSWSSIPILPAGIHSISSVSFRDSTTGMILSDSGLYRTENGGKIWSFVPSFPTIARIAKVYLDTRSSSGFMVHGANDFALSRSTDEGRSWSPVLTSVPTGSGVSDVFIQDSLNSFAFGAGGAIYRTSDGGTVWRRVHGFGSNADLLYIHFSTPARGAAFSNVGAYLVSSDSGTTWSEYSLPGDFQFIRVDFSDPVSGHALLRSRSGGFYFSSTTDGGVSWDSARRIPLSNYWGAGVGRPTRIASLGGGAAWLAGEAGTMYFTRDNGFTWDVKYLFPDYTLPDDNLRSFFALDPARFWYGQANFMTFTSDTLHTFTLVEPPTIAEELTNVGSIHFKDSMNGWCTQVWSAGGHEHEGFVLHTSDGGETWMRVPYLFGREFAWFGTDLSLCYSTSFPNEPIHMTENAWSGWIDFPPPSLYMLSYSIKSQSSFWGIGYNGRIYERKR